MIIGDVLRAALYLSLVLNLSSASRTSSPGCTWCSSSRPAPRCSGHRPRTRRCRTWCPRTSWSEANQYSLLGTFGPAPIAGLFFGLFALVSRSLGSISPYFSTDQTPGQPGAVLQRGHLRRLRDHHLPPAGDRQAAGQRAHLGALGGQDHLGGLEVHRPHQGGARDRHRHDRRLLGRGRGGRPGPAVHQEHARTAAAPAGGSCSPRSSSGWPRACSSACAILRGFSRRRLFGLSIVGAAVPLVLIGLIPSLVVTVLLVILLGALRRHRLRHRLHDRRQRGGRRHPGPDVRVPAVRHPGHPVRGDRDRAVPGGRVHRPGARRDRVGHAARRATSATTPSATTSC